MINLLHLTCYAALHAPSAAQPLTSIEFAVAPAAAVLAPQEDRRRPGGGSAAPGGGTPEPASMLLLAGGALGYLGLRSRKRKKAAEAQNDQAS